MSAMANLCLFGHLQGVIDRGAQVPDGAFPLGMPDEQLDDPQIRGPPQRMSPVGRGI